MLVNKLQVFHGDTTHQNPCIVMHLSQPNAAAVDVERKGEGSNVVRVHTMRSKL